MHKVTVRYKVRAFIKVSARVRIGRLWIRFGFGKIGTTMIKAGLGKRMKLIIV